MGWAETVFRLGRLLGWLVAKLGASFISLSANALLGLCCKEAIYLGKKNTISNQFLQKKLNKQILILKSYIWLNIVAQIVRTGHIDRASEAIHTAPF
jgi:hypothetical protein